jgi:isoleucyl-tRNA synthetase
VDMYLEGSDQHRGWFQSSLLTSVAANGIAPYKTVLTHGFVLDEQGRKMSKSLGNVVDPYSIINGGKDQKKEPAYGVDVLRLWVSSVDYTNDVNIGQNIVKQLADIRNKIRNTARFLLGSLDDFDPARDGVAYEELPEIDRYMLHRISEVFTEVTDAFETFQFFRFFQTVQNFCVVDLSNFYIDIAKDRLYISDRSSFRRRSAQTVYAIALENLAKAIAPVLCHLAEDIWQYLPYKTSYKSVFESGWVNLDLDWNQPQLAEKWLKLRQIRSEVNKVMEVARNAKAIGASLEAKVLLYVPAGELKEQLIAMNPIDSLSGNGIDELRYLFLASQVELVDSPNAIQRAEYKGESDLVSVGIVKADGQKCDRCWNYSPLVGTFPEDPTICERCNEALKGAF